MANSRWFSVLAAMALALVTLMGWATAKDEIVVAHIGQITSIDPAYPNWSSNSNTVYGLVYEPLIKYARDSLTEFVPVLATEVPSRENGLIMDGPDGSVLITFPIRTDVKFHEGGTLTPEDVKYSFLRKLTLEPPGGEAAPVLLALTGYESLDDWAKALEPGIEGFAEASDETVKAMFEVLDQAITIDGDKVTFRLKVPTGLFLQFIAQVQPAGQITDREWVIEQGGWPGTWETWKDYYNPKEEETALYDKANGTGPFRIVRWDITSQEMTLERFDDYWQGPARIKTVRLKYVEEWSTRKLMLLNGDTDFAYVPPQFIPQVEGLPGITVSEPEPSGVIRVIFFQWPINGTRFTGSGQLDGNGIPPDFFADINVRKGFLYAFNWDRFIEEVLGGNAFQIKGPVSTLCPVSKLDIPVYHYDREKAIEYLKAAFGGQVWEKGFYFVAVHNAGNFLAKSALELLREELRSINPKFNFDIHAATWNEFIPLRTSSQIPLFYSGWGFGYPDGYDVINAYLASDGYFNPYIPGLAELCKTHVDPILDQALRTFDANERAKLYAEVLKFAYEYATHFYVVEEAVRMVYRNEVKGWYFHPALDGINMPGIDFYSLYKE